LVVLLVAVCLIGESLGESRSLTSQYDRNICTGAHNKLRWLHKGTRGLKWDTTLAEKAQAYADELVRINQQSDDVQLPHSQTPEVGENLFWREGEEPAKCAHAVLRWYSEIVNYDFATTESSNGKSSADFTQIVWKNTKSFGLGIAVMQARGLGKYYGYLETFIVAMYSPSGNVYTKGEKKDTYLANVLPRRRPCNGLSCVLHITKLDRDICADVKGPDTCKQMIEETTCVGRTSDARKTKRECKKSCGICQ